MKRKIFYIILILINVESLISKEFKNISQKNITDQLLDTVLRSPIVVGKHLKNEWLNLFSNNGSVEDPVGTSSHSGKKDLSGFWEVFIASVNVTFIAKFNIVIEDSLEVIRNVNISATLTSGVRTIQPAIILYKLVLEGDSYKIQSLQAHWVLMDRILETLGQKSGFSSIIEMGYTLLKNFGISGALGYMKGFSGVHTEGIKISKSFFEYIKNKNKSKWVDLLKKNSQIECRFHYKNKTFFSKGVEEISNFFDSHILKNELKLSFIENHNYPSGWKVAGILEYISLGNTHNSAYIFEFDKSSKKIISILIIMDSESTN